MSAAAECYRLELEGPTAGPFHFLQNHVARVQTSATVITLDITIRDQSELLGLLRQIRDHGLILNTLTRLKN
ncbi:hypothetical protein [Thalassolituus sp.]|jgi:hypothetical protein|uniref:hypothetical protein n=1 Tax=Thalassolituus sp. TaxID=2030822 RepID=UPI0035194BF9